MESNATDTVKAAPTAILCVRHDPSDLSVLEVRPGDDLEEIIRGTLGGEPESMGEPGPNEVEMGVIGVYRRGNTSLHVHTHPSAFEGLQAEIDRYREIAAIAAMFAEAGLNVHVVRMDSCICGQCDIGAPIEAPAEDDLS